VTLAQSTQRKHCALPTHRPHRNNRTLTTTRVTEQTRDTCTQTYCTLPTHCPHRDNRTMTTTRHEADTWHLHEALSACIAHSPHTVLTEVTELWQLHTSQSRHVTLAQSTQRTHCALSTHRPHRGNRTLTTTHIIEQTRDSCRKHSAHALRTPHTPSSQR